MKILVLDLDGVLVGSKEMYASVVHEALSARGFDLDLVAVVSARVPHVGRWVDALVPDVEGRERVVGELTGEVRSLVPERAGELEVRESAREVLEQVSATHRMFLVTNSSSRFAHAVLDDIGLWGLFEQVITSDHGLGDKAAAIVGIAGACSVEMGSVVYVGDTRGDVEAARKAGCRSVIVYTPWSWDEGAREAIEDEGPDAIAECFADLPAVLEGLG